MLTFLLYCFILFAGVFGEFGPSNKLQFINPLDIFGGVSGNATKCTQDIQRTISDIGKKGYASRMFDATAKIPDGLIIGNHQFLGQYDECLTVESNDAYNIIGKYCLLTLTIPGFDTSVISGPGGYPFLYSFGLCAPASCTAEDLNFIFNNTNLDTVFYADESACTAGDATVEIDTGAWVVIAFLSLLVGVSLMSTAYEVWQRFQLENDKPHPLLSSFSLYQNGKAVFQVKDTAGQMDCLNGMRTFSMFWVVFCHNALLGVFGNSANTFQLLGDLTAKKYVVMSNGYLSVDTFFFLSGLLVAFVFFRDIGRSGTYDAPRSYINRYIRLTPPYAVVLLIEVSLMKYFGNGPTWAGFVQREIDICEKWWWTGLLYVQNIVNPAEMCMLQTWYLSADMQVYLLAPLFLYPLYLWPKKGAIFVGAMTVLSSLWSFGIAVAYKLPYSPFFDVTGDEDRMDNYPFWSRMSPWFVGMLLGFLICGLKAKKIEVKLTITQAFLGWIVSSVLCCTCLFGEIWFLDNPDYTVVQSAAFLTFHRVGWALGLAWIVFACIYGYGGPVNGFLSWGLFQPLGKLSYCVYLVHITVMYVVYGDAKSILFIDLKEMTYSFLYILMISYLAAIILSLFIEMPFCAIDRYFFRSLEVFPYPSTKPKAVKTEEKTEVADAKV